jgi:transposase
MTKRGQYRRGNQTELFSKAMGLLIRGYTRKEVSETLEIPQTTLRDWIAKGEPPKARGGATKVLITEEIKGFIQLTLDSDCWLSLEGLRERIQSQFDVTVGVSALSKCLKKLNITYKLIKTRTPRFNDTNTLKERNKYVAKMLEITEEMYNNRVIFIDESGFQPAAIKQKGWAKSGETPVQVQQPREKMISVVGAITGQGTFVVDAYFPENQADNFNSLKFRHFMGMVVQQVKTDMENNGYQYSDYLIVLDNAKYHKKGAMTDFWDDCSVPHLYLPPYSPDLNAIENYWAKMKALVVRTPLQRGESYAQRLQVACQAITPQDCLGFVKHTRDFFPMCIRMEPITPQ